MASPYITWLIIFMVLPVAALWAAYFELLWSYRRTIGLIAAIALLIGIPWDVLAARLHIWGWASGCCTLPRAQGVPLEEALFMLGVSLYASSLTIILRSNKLKTLPRSK